MLLPFSKISICIYVRVYYNKQMDIINKKRLDNDHYSDDGLHNFSNIMFSFNIYVVYVFSWRSAFKKNRNYEKKKS